MRSNATYEAAIALGEMLLAEGEWERARPWLDDAYGLSAAGSEARARALFRVAETYALEGRPIRHVEFLRLSLAARRTPLVEEALLEAMGDRGLVLSAEKPRRGLAVRRHPSVRYATEPAVSAPGAEQNRRVGRSTRPPGLQGIAGRGSVARPALSHRAAVRRPMGTFPPPALR